MAKFIDDAGIAHVRMISPGQGSSAYYKEDMLRKSGGAFEKHWDEAKGGYIGGLVFIDHPDKQERSNRPERSLRDLVGPIVGVPHYESEGKAGPGLYGDVRVASYWRPLVEEQGDAMGVSIRATGSAVYESINGKRTRMAEKLNPGAEFDFVTRSGRGGRPVPLYEAAQTEVDDKIKDWMAHADFTETNGSRSEEERFLSYLEKGQEDLIEKGDTMPNEKEMQTALTAAEARAVEAEKKVTELTAENAELTTNGARLAEAVGLRQAQDAIATALSKNTVLPDVTKVRITESISTSAPLVEGKLDVAKLAEMIETAVTTETEYIESLSPKPSITGMGGGPSEDTDGAKRLFDRKKKQYLKEGKSEEDATRMANTFTEGR